MDVKLTRKLKLGFIGASPDTFIGSVHHQVSRMDGLYELVAGVFSSDENKSFEIGKKLNLDPDRVYPNWEEFLENESEIKDNNLRIDVISIVTPNNHHYLPAKTAIKLGFHVIVDKPLCLNLIEAYDLEKTIKSTNQLFCLTHAYTGYPMVREARDFIKSEKIGKVRKVFVEYPQGWLSQKIEDNFNNKNAKNRLDENITGKSCTLSDIGTHSENLLEYVTGLKITEVCSDSSNLVEGRLLDDDSSILLKLNNGAKGVILCGQALSGEENGLKIKVYGDKGGLEWSQENNNSLRIKWQDKPEEIYRTGSNNEYLSKTGKAHSRVPSGHPEGYIEAFANIYRNFAYSVLSRKNKNFIFDSDVYDYPSIEEGVRGMLFVEKVLESSNSEIKWIKY